MRVPDPPPPRGRVVVLSGAGLSAPSGVPTFRGPDGLWEGRRPEEVATPEAWWADRDDVRRFYAARRRALLGVRPNPGHEALVELQQAWGARRVVLVTQNVDGLIQRAAEERARAGLGDGRVEVLEMHGSLWRVRCEASEAHPRVRLDPAGDLSRADGRCRACGAHLRPDVVWFGEVPRHMDEILGHLARCDVFLSVGTSGLVYPAAGFVEVARRAGARCIEVNPAPTGGPFHDVVAAGAETALPAIVRAWLASGGAPR